MDIPNYGDKQKNPSQVNQRPTIMDELEKRERIRNVLNQMKYEIASEMGYDHIKIPGGGDFPSRDIGVFAGPVGGVIVKDLITAGEKALLEKYRKNKK